MSDLAAIGLAYAYANYGRWVVDCPRPWCTNAMQVDRWQLTFSCLGPDSCGRQAPIIWPADPDAIEVILAQRPAKQVQNWAVGETLEHLLMENAAHGCIPDEWTQAALAAPGGGVQLIETRDEYVVGGILLPAIEAQRVLHAIES